MTALQSFNMALEAHGDNPNANTNIGRSVISSKGDCSTRALEDGSVLDTIVVALLVCFMDHIEPMKQQDAGKFAS